LYFSNRNEACFFWTVFVFCLAMIFIGGFWQQKDVEITIDDVLQINIVPPELGSVSYLVGEINSGKILFKRNSRLHLFPASLAKLMTGMIVLNNFSLDEEIIISDYAVSIEGEEGGLVANEKIKADDLLKILLISSSNDAAKAFEEALDGKGKDFVGLMNEKAREIGLFNTAFFDTSGLDRQGNFTSIEDMFFLSREIYKNYPYLGEITSKKDAIVYSIDGTIVHEIENTNILVDQIDNLWGGKTGSTPEARDCLLTIYEFPFPGKDDKIVIAIIVLNSLDRFGDTMELYNWTKDLIENN
jgi:serine-type D-Ala-D-Ala carboxypeptidase (penicillin-binding protein 5/6)